MAELGGGIWALSFQLHLCTTAREMRVQGIGTGMCMWGLGLFSGSWSAPSWNKGGLQGMMT